MQRHSLSETLPRQTKCNGNCVQLRDRLAVVSLARFVLENLSAVCLAQAYNEEKIERNSAPQQLYLFGGEKMLLAQVA